MYTQESTADAKQDHLEVAEAFRTGVYGNEEFAKMYVNFDDYRVSSVPKAVPSRYH